MLYYINIISSPTILMALTQYVGDFPLQHTNKVGEMRCVPMLGVCAYFQ